MASENTAEHDLLNMDFINGLPHPIFVRPSGGWWWPLYDIDVQTGLLRIDVCGMLDVLSIGSVLQFKDSSGKEYDPEQFYSDYEQEPAA